MRSMMAKVGGVLILAFAMAIANAATAEAAFIAWICNDAVCDTVGDKIVVDNSADDADPTVGSIVAVGPGVGGLTTTINVSTSKPILPEPSMDLNFTASGVGTAWLFASDTDFNRVAPLTGVIDGNQSGAGSVQAFVYGGVNNVSGTLSAPVSTGVLTGSSFHAQLSKDPASVTPYALTLGVKIVRTTRGVTTGDFLVVPEPASLSLFGLALLGFGGAARRRFLASRG